MDAFAWTRQVRSWLGMAVRGMRGQDHAYNRPPVEWLSNCCVMLGQILINNQQGLPLHVINRDKALVLSGSSAYLGISR